MLRIRPRGSKGQSYIHDDPIAPELWGGPALLPEPQKLDTSPLRNILTRPISLFWKVLHLDQNHNNVAAINPYSAAPQLLPYPPSTASRPHCCWRCQDMNFPAVDPAKLVCNVCWDLDLERWSITITLLNVLDAARRGCGTCDMIRRAILACATEGEIQRVVGIASQHEGGTSLGIEWISLKLRAQERESGEVGGLVPRSCSDDPQCEHRLYILLFALKGQSIAYAPRQALLPSQLSQLLTLFQAFPVHGKVFPSDNSFPRTQHQRALLPTSKAGSVTAPRITLNASEPPRSSQPA
jgi:hypothetical protein